MEPDVIEGRMQSDPASLRQFVREVMLSQIIMWSLYTLGIGAWNIGVWLGSFM